MSDMKRVSVAGTHLYVDAEHVVAVMPVFSLNDSGEAEVSATKILCQGGESIELEGVSVDDAVCDLGWALTVRYYRHIDRREADDGELVAVADPRDPIPPHIRDGNLVQEIGTEL